MSKDDERDAALRRLNQELFSKLAHNGFTSFSYPYSSADFANSYAPEPYTASQFNANVEAPPQPVRFVAVLLDGARVLELRDIHGCTGWSETITRGRPTIRVLHVHGRAIHHLDPDVFPGPEDDPPHFTIQDSDGDGLVYGGCQLLRCTINKGECELHATYEERMTTAEWERLAAPVEVGE